MLATLLLGLTLAMPESGETTMAEVDLSAGFSFRATTAQGGSGVSLDDASAGRDLGGLGAIGLTVYGKHIVDDDAPPALQPFLQYATQLHIGGGGSYTDRLLPASGDHWPLAQGWAEVSASGYLARRFYLATSFEYGYLTWRGGGQGISEQLQQFSVAAGLRFSDVRIAAGWGGTAYRIGRGPATVRFWGGAFLDLYTVIDRNFELDAGANLAEGGGEGHVGATWWLGRRLGLGLGASGGAHAYVDSPAHHRFVSGTGTVQLWFTPRVGAQLADTITWDQPAPGEDDILVAGIGESVTLTLLIR